MGKIRLCYSRSVTVERTKLNCKIEVADVIYTWGTGGLVRGLMIKDALAKPAELSSISRTYRLKGKYRKHRLVF